MTASQVELAAGSGIGIGQLVGVAAWSVWWGLFAAAAIFVLLIVLVRYLES